MAVPTKPRLKQGETPQSPSFQKRMREFNRQVALAEATKAQEEQNAREAKARAERDVLNEVSTAIAQADEDSKPKKPKSKPKAKPEERVAESGRSALENRRRRIDEAVEGKK